MNKKTYLSPETVSLRMEVSSLMQNASQSPFAEAKQHNFSAEEGPDDYEDAHPEDLWK